MNMISTGYYTGSIAIDYLEPKILFINNLAKKEA